VTLAASLIRLDAPTVLLQWATGSLLFLWVTTRGRLVGLGYGWLTRWTFAFVAAISIYTATRSEVVVVREVASAALIAATMGAFGVSYVRRRAGVSGKRALEERKSARVAAMVAKKPVGPEHVDGAAAELATGSITFRDQFGRLSEEVERKRVDGPEFPPVLDLIAPAFGAIGLIAGALNAGGSPVLSILRTLVGAAFLGAVSDAMLLGHWYLVQPGLPRQPIMELNSWLIYLWPAEVILLLVPTGMVSVLNGSIEDGWHGMLGWFWVACAITTIILAFVTQAALKERFYSAVMAATGLLYLAILTAFGTDIVARAILSR
jgi:hypothetical protein